MRLNLKVLLAGALLTATAGCATMGRGPAVDPIAQRQLVMRSFGGAGAAAGAQARGSAPYNAATVRQALDVYAWGGSQLAGLWPNSSQGGRSLPAIWANRGDFNAKIIAFNADIAAARAAADNEAGGKAALTKVLADCGGCHTPYRGPAPGGAPPAR